MTEYIVIGATYIVAFFTVYFAYRKGLQDGMNINKGKDIQVMKNPVKSVIEAVEQHKEKKEADKLNEELTDIMNASRETMLQAIKKGEVIDG